MSSVEDNANGGGFPSTSEPEYDAAQYVLNAAMSLDPDQIKNVAAALLKVASERRAERREADRLRQEEERNESIADLSTSAEELRQLGSRIETQVVHARSLGCQLGTNRRSFRN